MLKPDHAQARLRRLAAAIIVAAPPERVLLQWNQFVRQLGLLPHSRALGPPGRGLFLRKSGRLDLRWGGLATGGQSRWLITVWLEVRVLPSPPRSLPNREISQRLPTSPQLAGFSGCVWVSAETVSGLNAILGVVSLGRGISFPRCGSILDKTCACSCARRCFYVTPRCPRRPSANSIVYPSGS